MEYRLGEIIKKQRIRRQVSQEDLACALGVSAQAVSKWETGKANPDLFLLPRLAEYFGIAIDALFYGPQEEPELPEEAAALLAQNSAGWTEISETSWQGTYLPWYAPYTPTEDELCLMGDVRNKAVLEIACGTGESLLYLGTHRAKELWGLDISAARIAQANRLLREKNMKAKLFVSPMESDPGLPHCHFDLVYSIYGLGWSIDLDKTVSRVAEYLKPGGQFIFSWDNPLMQCIDAAGGNYRLARSYVQERNISIRKMDSQLHLRNWKLSTYMNCLTSHGFLIERMVEESAWEPAEAALFQEGKYYSAGKAALLNPAIIIKAKKL